jgi:hypothetical protein
MEVRQQAIRDLNGAMVGPVRTALQTAKSIDDEGRGTILEKGGPPALMRRLEIFQTEASNAFTTISDILQKYRPYADVQNITTTWRYDEITEKTRNYIELLRIAPNTREGIAALFYGYAGAKARDEWTQALNGFNGWSAETIKLIAQKNAEYEKAEVR